MFGRERCRCLKTFQYIKTCCLQFHRNIHSHKICHFLKNEWCRRRNLRQIYQLLIAKYGYFIIFVTENLSILTTDFHFKEMLHYLRNDFVEIRLHSTAVLMIFVLFSNSVYMSARHNDRRLWSCVNIFSFTQPTLPRKKSTGCSENHNHRKKGQGVKKIIGKLNFLEYSIFCINL